MSREPRSTWMLMLSLALAGTPLLPFGEASAQADPMQPPTPAELAEFGSRSAARPDESFRLQSILIAPERRVAIVNEQRVQIGHRVDGASVTAIDADGVVLEFNGRTIDLKVRTWSDYKQD